MNERDSEAVAAQLVAKGYAVAPEEAGADVEWRSFDHPAHGYSLLGRGSGERFESDPLEEQAFELYMEFFDEHLR